jgi:HK97 family phage major capsid protein
MNLRAQRKALLDEARGIGEKARTENRTLTDTEIARVDTIKGEVDELTKKIDAADRAAKALKEMSDVEQDADTDEDEDDEDDDEGESEGSEKGRRGRRKSRTTTRDRSNSTFGERMIKSAAYKRFQKDNPTGAGAGTPIDLGRMKVGSMREWKGRKATLDTAVARLQPTRLPTIDQVDRDTLTLLDLIDTSGSADGAFEYLQVTGVTRNAAVVAEGGLKPLSDMTTQLVDAKPYTYADGYDITNQLLADAPAFATYMNNELEYSLDNLVEEKVLNGTGTNGDPRGLLNTTGVQQQPFVTDMVTTVRKAITKITRLPGGSVTGVVMSPEDDEAWDLLKDEIGRYYGQGPFGSGPGTAWGRVRAVSERLNPGQVILGDWRQIALMDVEGLSILAFNQHKDYAQRNLVYVRAELRAIQAIWRPNRFVVADITA